MGWKGCLWAFLLGWVVTGCGKRADLFRTPYDRALQRALRKQGGGWVSQGGHPAAVSEGASDRIMPGQFLRVVLETPQPLGEESSSWSVIRVDTLRVYEDSLVYLPWAGGLRIGGVPRDSVQKVLEAAAQRIFVGARLRVYPLYPYYVFGAVTQPGTVLMDRKKISFVELLPFLASPNREADFSRVKVLRGSRDSMQVFLVDAREAHTLLHDFSLQSGDILYLQQRGAVRLRLELQNYLALMGILQIANLLLLFLYRR